MLWLYDITCIGDCPLLSLLGTGGRQAHPGFVDGTLAVDLSAAPSQHLTHITVNHTQNISKVH